MTIKLIAVDLDKTFLRADKTYDINKTKTVLKKIREENIKFVIATGNYIPTIEKYFDQEILDSVYLAADNGNLLKLSNNIINTKPIDRKQVRDIYNYVINKEGYYPIFSTGELVYVQTPLTKWAEKEISFYFYRYKLINQFTQIPMEENILKIELFSEHSLSDTKKLMIELENLFPAIRSVTSGDYMLDIYHKDGGKGNAIKFLQEKYGITKEQTMSFGDSLNDLSMMEVSKYSIAMGDADIELKNNCRYVIGTSEEQSVLDIIENVILKKDIRYLEKIEFSRNH